MRSDADLPASGFSYGRIRSTDTLHLTGGLRALRAERGWLIGPVRDGEGYAHMGPVPDPEVARVASELGVHVFGADEQIFENPHLTTRVWRPFVGLPPIPGLPTEIWASIGHHAADAGDFDYGNIARYIAVCLRAADIRLRDLSDGYGNQLNAALAREARVGHPFENIPLSDMHLAIHSLVAEMGAARDYLATLVGRSLGAPPSKDSLARFIDWIDADARAHLRAEPAAQTLLAGWRDDSADPWLRQLTEYRNLFLHRGPMGARGWESAPRLAAASTAYGEVRTLVLPIPGEPSSPGMVDALGQFVRLHWHMFHLAARLASLAPYARHPPVISSEDIVRP